MPIRCTRCGEELTVVQVIGLWDIKCGCTEELPMLTLEAYHELCDMVAPELDMEEFVEIEGDDPEEEPEGLVWDGETKMDGYAWVMWPKSQKYMDEPWFSTEAVLDNTDPEQAPQAYFLPVHRMEEYCEKRRKP